MILKLFLTLILLAGYFTAYAGFNFSDSEIVKIKNRVVNRLPKDIDTLYENFMNRRTGEMLPKKQEEQIYSIFFNNSTLDSEIFYKTLDLNTPYIASILYEEIRKRMSNKTKRKDDYYHALELLPISFTYQKIPIFSLYNSIYCNSQKIHKENYGFMKKAKYVNEYGLDISKELFLKDSSAVESHTLRRECKSIIFIGENGDYIEKNKFRDLYPQIKKIKPIQLLFTDSFIFSIQDMIPIDINGLDINENVYVLKGAFIDSDGYILNHIYSHSAINKQFNSTFLPQKLHVNLSFTLLFNFDSVSLSFPEIKIISPPERIELIQKNKFKKSFFDYQFLVTPTFIGPKTVTRTKNGFTLDFYFTQQPNLFFAHNTENGSHFKLDKNITHSYYLNRNKALYYKLFVTLDNDFNILNISITPSHVSFSIQPTTTSNLSVNQKTLGENIVNLNPFKFSSEYHDSAIGLVYYNYRHYNPNDGRWINRDPIAEEGGYNLYGLVDNNLINNIDIKGLIIEAGDPCSRLDPQKVKNTAGRIYNESASVSNCEGRSIDEIGRIMQVNMKMAGPELKGKIDLKVYESCKNATCNAMKDKETKNTHFILHTETRYGEFSEETQDKYKFRHGHADDFSPLEDEHRKSLPCRLPNGEKGIFIGINLRSLL